MLQLHFYSRIEQLKKKQRFCCHQCSFVMFTSKHSNSSGRTCHQQNCDLILIKPVWSLCWIDNLLQKQQNQVRCNKDWNNPDWLKHAETSFQALRIYIKGICQPTSTIQLPGLNPVTWSQDRLQCQNYGMELSKQRAPHLYYFVHVFLLQSYSNKAAWEDLQ